MTLPIVLRCLASVVRKAFFFLLEWILILYNALCNATFKLHLCYRNKVLQLNFSEWKYQIKALGKCSKKPENKVG